MGTEILDTLSMWQQQGVFEVITGIVFLVILMLMIAWAMVETVRAIVHWCRRIKSYGRGLIMKQRERKKQAFREMMAWIYTDSIEEAFLANLITRTEAQNQYRMLARNLGYWDCMPRRFCPPPPHAVDLKEKILERLSPETVKKLNGKLSCTVSPKKAEEPKAHVVLEGDERVIYAN